MTNDLSHSHLMSTIEMDYSVTASVNIEVRSVFIFGVMARADAQFLN